MVCEVDTDKPESQGSATSTIATACWSSHKLHKNPLRMKSTSLKAQYLCVSKCVSTFEFQAVFGPEKIKI